MLKAECITSLNRVRVNKIAGNCFIGVKDKVCCRIYHQRRPDYNKNIRPADTIQSLFQFLRTFSEKYDKRPHLRTVSGIIVQFDGRCQRIIFDTFRVKSVFGRTHLRQFAVNMKNMCAARFFVQIVNILSDDSYLIIFFQFGNQTVSLIRLCLREFLPAPIIKVKKILRLVTQAFNTCIIPPSLVVPHTFVAAKS